jgi:FkbM family methyltransferase
VAFDLLRRADVRHRARRYRARVDPAGIEWMCDALRPGDVVVDAGAYKAGYTYWIRERVGDAGQVFCFEPQPELARYLRRAVDAFSWTNVHVEEAGLSSESGSRTLHAPGTTPTQDASLVRAPADGEARRYEVRIDTLDRFLSTHPHAGPVRLVKCDVEGHELDVFRGAEQMLRRDRPMLLFECEARHDPTRPVQDVFRYLEDLGYHGSFFLHGARMGVEAFDVDQHQIVGRLPYVNNSMFVAEG